MHLISESEIGRQFEARHRLLVEINLEVVCLAPELLVFVRRLELVDLFLQPRVKLERQILQPRFKHVSSSTFRPHYH